jgi:hypothetical protein
MKSDRQAVRTALSCSALGCREGAAAAGAAGAAGGRAAVRGGSAGGLVGAAAGRGSAAAGRSGAAAAAGAAPGARARTAAWQPAESPATLARMHSTTSALVGCIHEQWAMKSFIVQAR